MMKKINTIYLLLIAVLVAISYSTMLSHILYSLWSNSYFSYSSFFADTLLTEIGGVSRYLAAFFSQSQWLLVVFISLAASFIAYSFTKITNGRSESMALSLLALCLLYGEYMDANFVIKLVSCGLVSCGVVVVASIFKKSRQIAIISTPIVLAILYLCIVTDKTVYTFFAMIVASVLVSRFILRLYAQKAVVTYLLFAVSFVYGSFGFYKDYNPSLAYILQMEQSVANSDWNKTLQLANKSTFSNLFTCYYSNLALLKTGQMSKYLFYLSQKSGAQGLVLPNDYYKLNDVVYDAIGLPSQALRCVYEHYVGFGKTYYNLERLIYYYKKCGKNALSEKFSLLLPSYTPPEPTGYMTTNIDSTLSNTKSFLVTLEAVVKLDRNNKAAYELLMAHYALSGRVAKFAELCSLASDYFSDGLPVYFQEVLVLYEEILRKQGDQLPVNYEIKSDIRAQYNDFNNGKSPNKYRNTFWFYFKFISPTKGKVVLN